jgi:hypothetical protein
MMRPEWTDGWELIDRRVREGKNNRFLRRLWTRSVLVPLMAIFSLPGHAQTPAPNPETVASPGLLSSERWRLRFAECDEHDTCDGQAISRKCSQDRNQNSVLLKLHDGTVLFNAKMGLDVDGSHLSATNPGQTDQAETSLRYPLPGSPSVDSDRVPYIVIPGDGFDTDLRVEVGDVAAVIHRGKRVYAVVGDKGPKCKIGEGSIRLHELLGHKVCKRRSSSGNCQEVRDTSVERDVLYFIFPHTRAQLWHGLTPANINTRLEELGQKSWESLLRAGKDQ